MKKVLLLLLSVILCLSTVVRGEVPSRSLQQYSYNYGRYSSSATLKSRRISERVRASEKATSTKSGVVKASVENLGHQGQALLLIMIISGVEIVHQQMKMARLKKQNMNISELMELAGEAADQILLGGSVYSSMVGAATVAGLSYRPLKVIYELIKNQKTKPIFKSLLQSGIVSFITFTGWEMGGQLWSEAKELIESEADYARAERLGPVLLGSMQSAVSTSEDSQNDFRILKLILGNMYRILVNDDDLRNLWLYNTWRLRIATGGFVTMVTSMVTVGALGTTLFPGAGTLGGMCFGILGGGLALFIPDSVKDGISDSLASTRNHLGSIRTETMRLELKSLHKQDNYEDIPNSSGHHKRAASARDFIRKMTNYREEAVTSQIEILYRNYSKLTVLNGNRKVALAANNTEAIAEIENMIEQATAAVKKNMSALEKFYKNEAERLIGLSPKPKSQELFMMEQKEYNRLLLLSEVISTMLSGLSDNNTSPSDSTASVILLNKIYFMGFKESYLGI